MISNKKFYYFIYIFLGCKINTLTTICLWVLQGAVALEDALSKGLPIQTEIDALRSYLDGCDKDSILDLVLSSLPEETRKNGTDTQLQLNQKVSYLYVLLLT